MDPWNKGRRISKTSDLHHTATYLHRELKQISVKLLKVNEFILTLVHSRNVKRRKIPASAIFSTKFASSIVSPASAKDKRIPNQNINEG